MKKILLPFILLLTGCSTTIVYAPKYNYNISQHGSSIQSDQKNHGSDLKDNQAGQDSAADIRLPIP
jgi:uncharacterized protein YceK